MAYIIGFIILIIVISMAKDFVKEHRFITLMIVAVILAFIFGGFAGGFGVLCLIGIGVWIDNLFKASNEKKLNEYLRANCLKCGYVSPNMYSRIAPNFDTKRYKTTFSSIVSVFLAENENKYIIHNEKWIQPAEDYIRKHIMADMNELMSIYYPGLMYSHCTSNIELIANAMDSRCQKDARKSEFLKIMLQEDAVRKELAMKKIPFNKYYLYAYKLNQPEIAVSDNFESEEISIDDL